MSKKRPYTIECRCTNNSSWGKFFSWICKWHKHSGYKTESARDEALVALQRKSERDYLNYEYRKGEEA